MSRNISGNQVILLCVGWGSGNFTAVLCAHLEPKAIFCISKITMDDFVDDWGYQALLNDLYTWFSRLRLNSR